MLLELKVSHFAIIENIHLHFREGLNILSGETGAGKSVLLKSLALLMGGKSSADTIRTGCTQAIIEGSFDISKRRDIRQHLEALGIETDENVLIVRRLIAGGDKSRVYLNGSLSTLNSLRDIVAPLIEVTGHSAPLIEMTGQHENRNLISRAYHLDLLDQYCGTWDRRHKYEEMWSRRSSLLEEIADLERNAQQKAQRLDFLVYQRDEIAKLDLSPGEDVELEQSVKRLKNASRLTAFVDSADGALYGDDDSAVNRINAVLKKAADIAVLDPTLAGKIQGLEQAKGLIDDSVYELRQYLRQIDGDPDSLEEKEARLSDLRKLQKKYGSSVDEIIRALIDMETEISQLQNSESHIGEKRREVDRLTADMEKLALDLHKRREKGAGVLADSVNGELNDLNMKGVSFVVQIRKAAELSPTGLSDVEFMTKTSPKDPPRPLAKAASGGELSRLLLSLKRVVGSSNQPRTYLFDEVDTGVSGPTAEKVGRKLKSIAKGQQVICVTHLPQVAAFGDVHFFIQKSPKKDSVSMEVEELDGSERKQEIARLISGEKITKTSLAHAEQLLAETR
ncbi:MAG: DNA repair protein RecN [Bdellovibrionaceae bacterium]|nr:DNA repair protein RecN [Pseudobdellovibrionaceae bacterium]MBX3032538.1 DNA repair protein RecN [Pseudobdellovibrionaceae bacterium]